MKFTKFAAIVSTVALAVVGSAFAAALAGPQHEIAIAKEVAGTWKKNVEITRQLNPDRSVWDIEGLSVQWDTELGRQIPTTHASMRDRTIIASGSITLDGKSYPCVIAEQRAALSLVWWLPGKESPFGEGKVSRVNMVVARDHASDLLFLGGEDGLRGATVCFSRSR